MQAGRRSWAWIVCAVVVTAAAGGCAQFRSEQVGAELGLNESLELDPSFAQLLSPATDTTQGILDALEPSNDREWAPDQAVLPWIDVQGNLASVHEIRDCTYRTAEDYDLRRIDKSYDLDRLRSLDFIIVPFSEMPALAHIMVSFGFEGGDYLGISVEIRKEKGEKYDPLKGMARQYEIMYVLATERDLIRLRTDQYFSGVYAYRSTASQEDLRRIFLDVARRVNELRTTPEFYHTLANNCTTNIVAHLNHVWPDAVPYSYQVLMPGYFDRLMYDLGLIESAGSFERTKEAARLNQRVYLYADAPDFSVKIRE